MKKGASERRVMGMAVLLAAVYLVLVIIINLVVLGRSPGDGTTFLTQFDAKGYHSLGMQILGEDKIDGLRLAQRGFLYPTIATGLLQVSPWLLFAVQSAAVAIGLFALAMTEGEVAGRIIVTPSALLSISLILSPGHMMTEALAFGTVATALYLTMHANPWAIPLIWIAAMIKPAFLLPAIIFTCLFVYRFRRFSILYLVPIALIAIQLVVTTVHNGRPAISTAGASNFQERFFPAAMGWREHGKFVHYKSGQAKEYRQTTPELGQQVRAVLSDPWNTTETAIYLLANHHLMTSTGYILRSKNPEGLTRGDILKKHSEIFNLALIPFWVIGVLGLAFFVKSRRPFAWAIVVVAPLAIATAPLVYWQGDRVVFVPLLLLLPFAGLALSKLFSDRNP